MKIPKLDRENQINVCAVYADMDLGLRHVRKQRYKTDILLISMLNRKTNKNISYNQEKS